MKLLAVDTYIDFECIGEKCPISCCGGGWGIEIEEESYKYYMSVEGEFGEQLKENIITEDSRKTFKLDEKTRECAFLNKNKLCKIYRELGPEALCYTCKTYPRIMYQVGDIMFCSLTNSCPEVNRMILQRRDMIKTLFDDMDEEMDDGERDIADKTDWRKFNNAIKAFTTGMHVIQNRDIAFEDRLYLILFYVERFQELMTKDMDVSSLVDVFSKPEIYKMFLEQRNKENLKYEYADRIHIFMMIYRVMMTDAFDHPMWKRCTELADDIVHKGVTDIERLKKAFSYIGNEDIQIEMEQIMAYRFFTVFMQGFDRTDYMDKLAYEVIMLVALWSFMALTEAIQERSCTREDRILFYSLGGRIDHSNNKKANLVSELKEEGFYRMDKLIELVR